MLMSATPDCFRAVLQEKELDEIQKKGVEPNN